MGQLGSYGDLARSTLPLTTIHSDPGYIELEPLPTQVVESLQCWVAQSKPSKQFKRKQGLTEASPCELVIWVS
jgi:hypothetical protein